VFAKPTIANITNKDHPQYPDPRFIVEYGIKGYGWGSLSFKMDGDKLVCDNEYSPKEIIALVMSKVIEEMELQDE